MHELGVGRCDAPRSGGRRPPCHRHEQLRVAAMEAEGAEPAQAPAPSAGDAPQAGAQPAARPPADAAGAGAPVAAAGASFIPGFFAGPRPGYTWSDEGGLGSRWHSVIRFHWVGVPRNSLIFA